MNEADAEELARKIAIAMTLVLCTGGLGIAVWLDRRYSRWWKEAHPFAGVYAGLDQTRATYRRRRDLTAEVSRDLSEVLGEVGRAYFEARPRA